MFKADYKHLSDQIEPNDRLIRELLEAARTSAKRKSRAASLLRLPALAALCVCLCVLLVLPALAATVDPVYRLMYLVSPSAAQFFMPVQRSDEDNGIKMEVVSAYIHENVAEIYVTMRDLTGDRIDATTDLYDSYSINRPFDSAAYCERVGYDDATKTATFLIRIEEWGSQAIAGDKITFSVREFLSHKKTYNGLEIPIDLSAVPAAEKTQAVQPFGGGGTELPEGWDETLAALVPGPPRSEFSVEGLDLTAIGYVNGSLRVQIAVKNRLENDNHGFLYLKDQQGNKIDCAYNFYFRQTPDGQAPVDYCEFDFPVPPSEISKYRLYGDFVTADMKTQGAWRVTFPLENAR